MIARISKFTILSVFIVLNLVLCSGNIPAWGETMSITGTVYDQMSQPVVEAIVTAQGKQTLTDRDGNYVLDGLQPGKLVVTAAKNEGGNWHLFTKVAESDRFDFVLWYWTIRERNQWGTIRGSITRMGNDECIAAFTRSENGWSSFNLWDPQTEEYELNLCKPGTNSLLVREHDHSSGRTKLVSYKYFDDITISENGTVTQNITLSDEGLETVSGTFPPSYLTDYQFFAFEGGLRYNIFGSYNGGSGLEYLYNTVLCFGLSPEHTSFSEKMLPDILGDRYVMVKMGTGRAWYLYKKVPDSKVVNITETPQFIDILTPAKNEEHTGSTPYISWSGPGKVFTIYMGLRITEFSIPYEWMVETMDREFQVPQLDFFSLGDAVPRVILQIMSFSYMDENFVIEDDQSVPLDYSFPWSSINFFPGDKPDESSFDESRTESSDSQEPFCTRSPYKTYRK